MIHFILRRLGQSLLVLLVMSVLVFAGVYAIGDPIDILINPQADQMERERVSTALGLGEPLYKQYGLFLSHAVQGDLGNSFSYNVPALSLVFERLPATLELAVCAMLIAVLLGIPLGLWAGLRPRAFTARLIGGASILGFSLPTFWVGMLLIMFFAVQLGWLPSGGRGPTVDVLGVPVSFLSWEGLQHLALPALNLALFKLSLLIRLTRASTRDALQQDYVRTARAKGLKESRVVGVHVLRNIMLPIITVAGLEFGSLIAFAVVTETLFAWPGMGKLIIDAITMLDRPLILAYLLVTVLLFTAINLLTDLLYGVFDPRVRARLTA
ncbi:MAG TPA: ABC transporter permease [Burkholderiales bacterium]|nr:ABC transporter permease [Burkholderiales bacterium]